MALLKKANEIKDLDILVDSSLTTLHSDCKQSKEHCFCKLTPEIFLPFQVSLIRPLVKYIVQAFYPYLIPDIQHVERVQWLVTWIVQHLWDLPYESRTKKLNFFSLEFQWLINDLLLAYNFLNDKYNTTYNLLFTPALEKGLCGHKKLFHCWFWLNKMRAAFSIKITKPRNKLPPTTQQLKINVNRCWANGFSSE